MKTYELTYIISPEITLEQAEEKAKGLETLIQSKEGVILKQSNPTAKALAYPIAKRASGFLGILEFQMEPEKLPELKEMIAKEKAIVRQMIVVKPLLKAKKERRTRVKAEPVFTIEKKQEEVVSEPKEQAAPAGKEKVELKDIEEKLEEILGQ
jgi:small subunit ribosomal protein S6